MGNVLEVPTKPEHPGRPPNIICEGVSVVDLLSLTTGTNRRDNTTINIMYRNGGKVRIEVESPVLAVAKARAILAAANRYAVWRAGADVFEATCESYNYAYAHTHGAPNRCRSDGSRSPRSF